MIIVYGYGQWGQKDFVAMSEVFVFLRKLIILFHIFLKIYLYLFFAVVYIRQTTYLIFSFLLRKKLEALMRKIYNDRLVNTYYPIFYWLQKGNYSNWKKYLRGTSAFQKNIFHPQVVNATRRKSPESLPTDLQS